VTEMAEAEASTPANTQPRDKADDKPKRRGWWSMGR